MEKLRLLTIAFDTEIQPWELRAFRGAISEKAGIENEHFHNHDNENGGYHYRYPLIQYKFDKKRPMLVCLNDGVEEMHHFFSKPDWTLDINGHEKPMRIARLDMKEYTVQPWEHTFRYHIRQWIGLNEENYRTYQRLTGLLERTLFLQTVLTNQLVAFCTGVSQKPERNLTMKILEIKEEKWVTFKKVKMLAFSLTFESNLSIPDFIGIGKGASVGWGVVRRLKNDSNYSLKRSQNSD